MGEPKEVDGATQEARFEREGYGTEDGALEDAKWGKEEKDKRNCCKMLKGQKQQEQGP